MRRDSCFGNQNNLSKTRREGNDGGIFRGFELSCIRDPFDDFAVREMKMKTDHDKMNVRKYELNRSRVKSREVW